MHRTGAKNITHRIKKSIPFFLIPDTDIEIKTKKFLQRLGQY
jgi:hypothetical protein